MRERSVGINVRVSVTEKRKMTLMAKRCGLSLPKPDNAAMFGVTPSGKARTWEDTFSRSAKVRSKTFPGIAAAMAEQWGSL